MSAKRRSQGQDVETEPESKRSKSLDFENSDEDILQDLSPSKARNGRRSIRGDIGLLDEGPEDTPEGSELDPSISAEIEVKQTPKKRGRPKGSKNLPKSNGTTPTKVKKDILQTPTKLQSHTNSNFTPSISRHVDRSARRKSARAIIENSIGDDASDVEEDDELARDIFNFDGEDGPVDDTENMVDLMETSSAPDTPSKRGRGRPKGSKSAPRKRSPTPPKDLPPHEVYFSQNKSTYYKTSNNALASLKLLTHEEYFTLTRSYNDHHSEDLTFLQDIHSRSFHQWTFELSQGFSLLLHGFGSKRSLVHSFANHLSRIPRTNNSSHKIVIINGYLPNSSPRDILTTISNAITSTPQKLGSQPAEMLESVLAQLDNHAEQEIYLLINSVDSTALRRANTQTLLARLSKHPRLHFLATVSHPNVALLWDSSLRSMFNFVFHDCTTFQPYDVEVDVVDEVHALLGRSGRRVGGKEGVAFVLKSLPVKARQLYGVLVSEQLVVMDENMDLFSVDDYNENENGDEDEEHDFGESTRKMASVAGGKREPGVEYRVLYQKAVEDFICPNEMTFRTLLKEFYDHQMITSRKDAMGTEMLSVPFRKEELETILEDIMA